VRVLAIVPARLGSKGIPRKNIRLLAGKPLLEYTAEAAGRATKITRAILSTEDEEIAAVGRRCGLEVPFLRPTELASDETPSLRVIQHAVEWLETRGDSYEAICLLEPTSPLRRADTIDSCLTLLEESSADAVVTVIPVPGHFNPHWAYFRCEDGTLRLSTGENEPISRRQDLPTAYCRDGSVYATRRDVIMKQNSMYGRRLVGYVVEGRASVNIDTLDDWKLAESLLRSGNG
jgi:CMP-N,N'-diacetyllegionaminic acid synthase